MLKLFRFYARLQAWGIPVVPRLLYMLNRILFSVVLPPTVVMGRNVTLAYQGLSTVVHARARIGSNVYIGPCVVIGGRGGEHGVPVIENNVFIGAGARVLGPVTVGERAVVAAGAVVIRSVDAGTTVAGVPAKMINSTRTEQVHEPSF